MSKMYDSLMASLTEEVNDIKEHGKSQGRRTKVTYKPLREYTAQDVKDLRKMLDVSQQGLASCLGVSKKTVEKWESGENIPSGPATRLFDLFNQKTISVSQYITYN